MDTQSTAQSSEATGSTTVWEIDPSHSSANFSVRHMMIAKVHGGFSMMSGTLKLDRNNPSNSSVEAVIDVNSIDTRDAKRDEHLKSADFFDARKFPSITFKSTRVKKDGDEAEVTGDLTIHGVTQEITLTVEGMDAEMKDPWGNVRIGGSATTRLKRKDFGLSWNAALETGGVLVGDDVNVTIELQFVKKS